MTTCMQCHAEIPSYLHSQACEQPKPRCELADCERPQYKRRLCWEHSRLPARTLARRRPVQRDLLKPIAPNPYNLTPDQITRERRREELKQQNLEEIRARGR